MKAILVMYDSLNSAYLSAYGCDWTHTPNFARLAARCAVFDNHFVGSLPCMPARRELHTGRYNFLHRTWGPLEPFDNSTPVLLGEKGIYTHLATDHMHYFEDGGATYHERYRSWEVARGQEGDPWKANVTPESRRGYERFFRQDAFNRTYIREEADFPMTNTFANGLEFLDRNHREDDWYLSIETFDPHEPFYAPPQYKALYEQLYDGGWPDWPKLGMPMEEIAESRYAYAALVSMCDANLGRLLDKMDALNLWDDTMLILNTDHGFLLGENDAMGKVPWDYYRPACNVPLMIWDPRSRAVGRRQALTQTIDIGPTLLEYFGVEIPGDMLGRPLREAIKSDTPVREAGLFGVHSHAVCVTDGRYIYVRAPREGTPCYNYTLMPTLHGGFFSLEDLRRAELVPPFAFSKDTPVLRVPYAGFQPEGAAREDLLFDTQADPEQREAIRDAAVERRMVAHLEALLLENDAPDELYTRLGLTKP